MATSQSQENEANSIASTAPASYPYSMDDSDIFLPPKAQRSPWVLVGTF